ncbi:hypothetical protein JKP88DRAFT_249416 [Tribonema minus]|uniref:Uncharacterized protein n=1 Tax=Tribonema minus TaxID=303371 RepID=A0A835YMR4_9STRA|nr:hypothetical protein JKP88DRAFT_249416 [Tribonema minus]
MADMAAAREARAAEERALAYMAYREAARKQRKKERRIANAAKEQVSTKPVGAADTAPAPVNTYTFPKPPRPMHVEDVIIEYIPASGHMADMEALREARARQKHALAYMGYREAERKQRTEEQRAANAANKQVKDLTLYELMMQFMKWGYDIVDQVVTQDAYVYEQRALKVPMFECRLMMKYGTSTPPFIEVCSGTIVPPAQQTSLTAPQRVLVVEPQMSLNAPQPVLAVAHQSSPTAWPVLAAAQQSSPTDQPERAEPHAALTCVNTKQCSNSQIEKPLTSFNYDKSSKDELRCYCRECEALMRRLQTRCGFISHLVSNFKGSSKQRGMDRHELTTATFAAICIICSNLQRAG